jgi:hypothetical protein
MPRNVAEPPAGLGPMDGKGRSDHPSGTSPARAAIDCVLDVALVALLAPLPACRPERRRSGRLAGIGSGDRKDRPVEAARALPTLAPISRVQEPSSAGLRAPEARPSQDTQEQEQEATRAKKACAHGAIRSENTTSFHDGLPTVNLSRLIAVEATRRMVICQRAESAYPSGIREPWVRS